MGCYDKPHCYYQEDSSCEIRTNADTRYITFMLRGQHLCCWYLTIEAEESYDQTVIQTTMIEWYQDVVNEHPECLLEEESCGPTWSYGVVIN